MSLQIETKLPALYSKFNPVIVTLIGTVSFEVYLRLQPLVVPTIEKLLPVKSIAATFLASYVSSVLAAAFYVLFGSLSMSVCQSVVWLWRVDYF